MWISPETRKLTMHKIENRTVELSYFEQWKAFNPVRWQREPSRLTHPVLVLLQQLVGKDTVLDVGCGSSPDSRLFDSDKYVGVDVTARFVHAAHHLYHAENVVQGDARRLPFPDNSFDAVYCKDLLEHLPPAMMPVVVQEMMRVSRKQVLFILFRPLGQTEELEQREKYRLYSPWCKGLVDLAFWWNQYSHDKFTDMIREYGGTVVLMRDVPGEHPKHFHRMIIQVVI